MAYVRDIMKKDIISAYANDSVQRVSKMLVENRISNIPIINRRDELVGIVSEQDIIKAMESENFMKMVAKDIMTRNVLSVRENDCIEYVSKIFIERPYRRIPVIRQKKVIGVIRREDIISGFMKDYY